ncbi:glycosyltransferase family 4 protein [Cupriavidus metallidurans]|uniref:glycosyltransferase family 4 protein n=1 Tax=Cupriavidus metallidurans TaxID=119219 RepID=UPI003D72D66C
MKVLLLSRYGVQGASSRMRFYQYLPWLSSAGIECVAAPLITDNALTKKYGSGGYGANRLLHAYRQRIAALLKRHRFDLVWVEKEALPWLPAWCERVLLKGVPYVLDFDDAIFHNYDRHRLALVRGLFGHRIDRVMAGARLVVAGNSYLAQRAAAAAAPWVELLPTVVDIERYAVPDDRLLPMRDGKPRIVWIGSPSTARYLDLLAEPLAELAKERPFALRVIGGGNLSMPGVDVEVQPWSADTEVAAIADCDVGVMPLIDSPWEQGKCAYKLIQYMACGLPTVASPVGANCEVVVEGETGLMAATPDEWVRNLRLLLGNRELRQRLGAAGKKRVEAQYSLQCAAPRLVRMLQKAGGQ